MRTATPKQYLPLSGRPVLWHTLARLCAYPRLEGVMLGVSAQDAYWPGLSEDCSRLPRFLGTYTGGATRAHTVLNGLRSLTARAPARDWVLVHDAVRPCLRHADIDKLIAAVGEDDNGGLLALPISDTIKRADAGDRAVETVSREGLWRAYTPQMFRIGLLAKALERALEQGDEVTDEAAAMEAAGFAPRLVAGCADNIKITLPEDMALAELFLKRQSEER